LIGDLRDGDVGDLDLVFPDQVEQEFEGSFEDREGIPRQVRVSAPLVHLESGLGGLGNDLLRVHPSLLPPFRVAQDTLWAGVGESHRFRREMVTAA